MRAFNAQHVLESEFYVHSDYNTGASHLRMVTNRAFAYWLDVVCVFYIAVVTFSFVVMDNGNGKCSKMRCFENNENNSALQLPVVT